MMLFVLYLIFISAVAVIITVSDKNAARNHKRRISEKMLMSISLLGGSLAMYITMLIIRHKTKHKKFMVGIPLIIVLQMALMLVYALYSAELI